jgi:hypothetical protein
MALEVYVGPFDTQQLPTAQSRGEKDEKGRVEARDPRPLQGKGRGSFTIGLRRVALAANDASDCESECYPDAQPHDDEERRCARATKLESRRLHRSVGLLVGCPLVKEDANQTRRFCAQRHRSACPVAAIGLDQSGPYSRRPPRTADRSPQNQVFAAACRIGRPVRAGQIK